MALAVTGLPHAACAPAHVQQGLMRPPPLSGSAASWRVAAECLKAGIERPFAAVRRSKVPDRRRCATPGERIRAAAAAGRPLYGIRQTLRVTL